jgi:hypothetical protein
VTPPTLAFRTPAPAGGLPVSLDRLIESKLLVQANSGGGKSWAVRYLLEQTHGRVQHIVLDREGEFATLREHYAYLLAGREGDVAADVRSAKLLARKLLELGLSAVIDLSEMSLGQQKEYVARFVDAINHLPRALWKDCLIVIDEAHLFAPEKGKGSSVASEPIALLLSTGRKRGYCVVLATQRIAKLDKDVSAECLNKMIGRTSEEDLRRAGEELGMGKPESKSLRSLDPGTFWTYGPAIVPDPVIVRTGAVRTQPPKRGTARQPAPVAPAKIRAALSELADLPKQAADEERSLEDMRRQLRDAQAALARAEKNGVQRFVEKPVADPRAIERAVAAAVQPYQRRQEHARRQIERSITVLRDEIARLEPVAVSLGEDVVEAVLAGRVPIGDVLKSGAVSAPQPPVTPRAPREPSSVDSLLGKGERIVLTAVAQYPDGADRDQLTVLTGYKKSSRDTYLQRLQAAGLVDVTGGAIRATDAGVDALGADFEPLPTGNALRKYWLDKLTGGERAILEVLLQAYPSAVARDEISERTEYKKSSRDSYIQRLKARKLVESVGRSAVRASATLF